MSRPRLIYLVTEDWYFVAHRLAMARAAQAAGYEVHVATRVGRFGAKISDEGFILHPIDLRRGSINPFEFAAAVIAVRRLHQKLTPTIVHHVALQAAVIGSIAAVGLPVRQINSIVGLGSVFTSNVLKSRVARAILRPLVPTLLNRGGSLNLVENPDHRDALVALGVEPNLIIQFPGSGVDIQYFSSTPEPNGPMTAAFAGRMLEDKGVRALVAAHQILAKSGSPLQLLLAGDPDPANPNSITRVELEQWSRQPGIRWLGHVGDIREVWAKAHIAVLPSHGEGLPVSLLEAAACGRPIVATDVSGCREIARPDVNALLVPVEDAPALAHAISRLASDAAMRGRFGAAGRRIVEAEYSSERVGRMIVALYDRLSGPAPSA